MLTTNVDHDDHSTLLARYLADADVPCPACGYNLRNLTTDRCPECNQQLRLSVGVQDPCTGQLIGAMAGLLTCAGAAGLLLAFVGSMSLFRGDPPTGTAFLMFVTVPAIALGISGVPAALLASRAGRLWFAKRSWHTRRHVIFASWFIPAAFLAYYVSKV